MRTAVEIADRLGLSWDELQQLLNRGALDGVRLDPACLHKARRAFLNHQQHCNKQVKHGKRSTGG